MFYISISQLGHCPSRESIFCLSHSLHKNRMTINAGRNNNTTPLPLIEEMPTIHTILRTQDSNQLSAKWAQWLLGHGS